MPARLRPPTAGDVRAGLQDSELGVRSSNRPARRLYESAGIRAAERWEKPLGA